MKQDPYSKLPTVLLQGSCRHTIEQSWGVINRKLLSRWKLLQRFQTKNILQEFYNPIFNFSKKWVGRPLWGMLMAYMCIMISWYINLWTVYFYYSGGLLLFWWILSLNTAHYSKNVRVNYTSTCYLLQDHISTW